MHYRTIMFISWCVFIVVLVAISAFIHRSEYHQFIDHILNSIRVTIKLLISNFDIENVAIG